MASRSDSLGELVNRDSAASQVISAAIVAAVGEAIWVTGADGRLLHVNATFQKLWGRSPSELRDDPRRMLEWIHPEDRGHPIALDAADAEFRILRPDGTERWIACRTVSADEFHVHGPRWITFARDISDRKRDELRYALALAGSGAALWDWDIPGGQFRYAQPASRVIGRAESDLPLDFQGWVDAIHPDDTTMVMECVRVHFEGRAPYAVTYRLRQRDGSYRWYEVRGQVRWDADGKPVRMIGSIVDVDASRRADQALARSERQFRQLFDENPVCMWAYEIATLHIVAANTAAALHYGYDLATFLTLRLPDLHPPEDRQRAIESTARGDGPVRHPGVWRHVRSDGRRLDVEITTHDASIDGRACRVVQIVDVTERVSAAEALRTSEERFRITALVTNDAIWEWDCARDEVTWGLGFQKLFGYAAEEIRPQLAFWSERVHPEDRERVLTTLHEAARRADSQWREEYRFLCKDGHYAFVADRGVVISDAAGTPIRMVGGITDITPRKRTELEIRRINEELEVRVRLRTGELEAANSELDAFSYSVSHDLRAPLRAIDGFSRILQQEHAAQLDAKGMEHLEFIRAGARRMGLLIDDLLAFSRLGRQSLASDVVDMRGLAQHCADELLRESSPRVVDVTIAELPRCVGDASALAQVWSNLLTNAFKYTRPRTPARIVVDSTTVDPEARGHVAYRISDNGVGFDPRSTHKLFSVFQRLHPGEEFEGSGVGLAIVQRIVHRHGGRVWARSDGATGAEFLFTIPQPSP